MLQLAALHMARQDGKYALRVAEYSHPIEAMGRVLFGLCLASGGRSYFIGWTSNYPISR